MTLKSAIGADAFMLDLNGMDSLINDLVTPQQEEDVWEEAHQGSPDSPEIDDVIDQENYEMIVDTYDKFVDAELCLPDKQGRKIMARVTNRMEGKKG